MHVSVVSRFGTYPALPEEPTGYVVGFTVTHLASGRTVYRDAIVPFTDASTDDDAVARAWDALKDQVEVWGDACAAKSPLIGSVFVPPGAPDPEPLVVDPEPLVVDPEPLVVDPEPLAPPLVDPGSSDAN